MSSSEFAERFGSVRLLALDVDGVLTDGGVYVDGKGGQFRRFDIKDGAGLKRVMAAGVTVVLITSSDVDIVKFRARTLGIDEVHIGVDDKLSRLREIGQAHNLSLSQTAFMSDDIGDLPVMNAVGLPCAPADAVSLMKSAAWYITSRDGGRGAVRELCDLIVEHLPTP